MSKQKAVGTTAVRAVTMIVIGLLSVAQILPFYIKLIQSFEPLGIPLPVGVIKYWPSSFHFDNYAVAFEKSKMLEGYKNSLIITIVNLIVSTLIVITSGYVFAKKEFKGKKFVFILFLSTMMVPGELNMIPNYRLISKLGLTSTYAGVLLPSFVNVFGIFLVKQFMESIPNSLVESARIDGAGEARIIFRIVAPMCTTVIATFVILNFIGIWNDYLWPYTVLNDETLFTIQLKLMYFRGGTASSDDYILESASTIVATVPVLIVYFIFNRQFIEGMSISGLK